MHTMIFSKKNAGKWVASKKGKIIATDVTLENILQKVKKYKKEDLLLNFVPKTPFFVGGFTFSA